MARVVERTAAASSDISFPEYQALFGEAQGDNRREKRLGKLDCVRPNQSKVSHNDPEARVPERVHLWSMLGTHNTHDCIQNQLEH